jgi:hypothetical protein
MLIVGVYEQKQYGHFFTTARADGAVCVPPEGDINNSIQVYIFNCDPELGSNTIRKDIRQLILPFAKKLTNISEEAIVVHCKDGSIYIKVSRLPKGMQNVQSKNN